MRERFRTHRGRAEWNPDSPGPRETRMDRHTSYRRIFKEMRCGFAYHEMINGKDGNPRDYLFLEVNPSFERIIGLGRKNLIGRSVLEIWPDTDPVWIERYGRVAASGVQDSFTSFFTPMGRHFDVTAYSPRRGYFAVTFDDVTDRENAISELRKTTTLLKDMIENLRDVIMSCDDKGFMSFISPNISHLLGFQAQDLVGRNVLEFVHPDDRLKVQFDLGRAFANNFDTPTVVRLIHSSGRSVVIEENGKVITDESGKQRLVTVLRDISDKKALEDQIHLAQRMEAIWALAGGLAHDFNNLLTAIMGHAQLAQVHLSDTPQMTQNALESLLQIESASERAKTLARNLLTCSRKIEYKREKLIPTSIVEEAIRYVKPGRASVTFVLDAQEGCWAIQSDRGKLMDALLNIFGNALDAMPKGGMLKAKVRNIEGAPISLPAGKYVRIDVTDSGCGMDRNSVSKVFQPFFTTKLPGKGTGLGLATVYRFVQDHGGSITCESEKDRGTTFTMHFPALEEVQEDVRAGMEPSIRSGGERNAHSTVLVIDDEEIIRNMAYKILIKRGHRVLLAEDGESALRYLSAGTPIDLVLLDATMPGMGGLETLRKIRETGSAVRVVVSSGYGVSTDKEWQRAGVSGFLLKPYRMEELFSLLKGCDEEK